jgi:hypothetical protein
MATSDAGMGSGREAGGGLTGLLSRLGVDKLRRPPKVEVVDPVQAAKFTDKDQVPEWRSWAEVEKAPAPEDDFAPETLRGPNTVSLRQRYLRHEDDSSADQQ